MHSCTIGMWRDGRHRVHVWLGNVLDLDRNAPLPDSDRLVVRGRDESTIVVDKRDGVHGAEVAVVLLNDFVGSHIPLVFVCSFCINELNVRLVCV